jgi:hypothetical protein
MREYQRRPGLKGRKFEHFFLVECENASESPIIDSKVTLTLKYSSSPSVVVELLHVSVVRQVRT